MDERPGEIVSHIEQQRERLGRNLDELENKVKSTTDWRTHFDKNPMLAMGVALGGGILLSAMLGGSGNSHRSRSRYSGWSQNNRSADTSSLSSSRPGSAYQLDKVAETVDNIKGALFGFAAAKVKTLLTDALPGFDQHLNETERKNAAAQPRGTSGTQSSSIEHGSQMPNMV